MVRFSKFAETVTSIEKEASRKQRMKAELASKIKNVEEAKAARTELQGVDMVLLSLFLHFFYTVKSRDNKYCDHDLQKVVTAWIDEAPGHERYVADEQMSHDTDWQSPDDPTAFWNVYSHFQEQL